MPLNQALVIGEQIGLDVVEVSPNSNPPVCKLMDFGKYKYQLNKKSKSSKKTQVIVRTKEVKLRPTTNSRDVDVKIEKVRSFLKKGNRVKVGIFLKGREMIYKDRAFIMLDKIIKMLDNEASVIELPKPIGRTVFAVLTAKKQ